MPVHLPNNQPDKNEETIDYGNVDINTDELENRTTTNEEAEDTYEDGSEEVEEDYGANFDCFDISLIMNEFDSSMHKARDDYVQSLEQARDDFHAMQDEGGSIQEDMEHNASNYDEAAKQHEAQKLAELAQIQEIMNRRAKRAPHTSRK